MHRGSPNATNSLGSDWSIADQDKAGEEVWQRSKLLKELRVIAGDNLSIAQHRDTLRYARIRGGGYIPLLKKFSVGDYVYARHVSGRKSLDSGARGNILRVKEVREKGTLLLEGRDTSTIVVNAVNCSPCHLTNIDSQYSTSTRRPQKNMACQQCGFPDNEKNMVLCTGCDLGWHTSCLNPPMTTIPSEDWFCPNCKSETIVTTPAPTPKLATTPAPKPPPALKPRPVAAAPEPPAARPQQLTIFDHRPAMGNKPAVVMRPSASQMVG
jgi:hypothetical protein